MIGKTDLTGVDEKLALRVIATALSIAPCLHTLEGDDRETAIAILSGVAAEAKSRGARHVKGQSVGPARVDYGASESWFFADDRASLRALCSASASPGGPIGSFPTSSLVSRLWPEER
ncbi:hypothetical protein [Clavibacter sp. VKM Ac-2872]|uniref:hypothetical protein n=1 Tax=Clavibacter sp. VKM Ac-2872 TaxID=2783812 RepID=UPI00188A4C01|nr:hypothetical protein [Clavibacter sp. VKM Ac-2872]MBF4625544.1 hypothetical protein [Clavibacter sp. VKM Ac-2872]